MERDTADYCFSPAESEVWRTSKLRFARKTAVQPTQVDRRKPNPVKQPGALYHRASYSRAIRRGCVAAGVRHWSPNQLRHSAATKIREQFGLEAAQVILGHSRADVTQVYAERNSKLALDVVNQIG